MAGLDLARPGHLLRDARSPDRVRRWRKLV